MAALSEGVLAIAYYALLISILSVWLGNQSGSNPLVSPGLFPPSPSCYTLWSGYFVKRNDIELPIDAVRTSSMLLTLFVCAFGWFVLEILPLSGTAPHRPACLDTSLCT